MPVHFAGIATIDLIHPMHRNDFIVQSYGRIEELLDISQDTIRIFPDFVNRIVNFLWYCFWPGLVCFFIHAEIAGYVLMVHVGSGVDDYRGNNGIFLLRCALRSICVRSLSQIKRFVSSATDVTLDSEFHCISAECPCSSMPTRIVSPAASIKLVGWICL